ncbi:hypothetical protein [Actinacidiphila paucisporea]|uniref:Uncharacterized protein n=1 Tax=Actinacidiphila paucisporea TaxID=310782 RepID=A0A1M7FZ85_9ACTN|nr:hypothetical protein [Actinacidiphila paucisporea]SHM08969.1 hypothetical protein SAMN05216499_10890 [Actinacidiphila paucisporea]
MTHDVPPPSGPPAPPPNAGGPSGTSFDPASVDRLDWAILGIGAVVFVFSFFDYYSWDFGNQLGIDIPSVSWGAWHFDHGLFIAWFAMVLTVLGAAVLAVSLFAPAVTLPSPARALSFLAFAAGFVLYLVAIFAHSDFGPGGGHAFSFWISLILAGAGSVIALMRAQQTGTPLPGQLNSLPRIGK